MGNNKKVNTPFGVFDALSPLSYHLNPVGFKYDIVTDIVKIDNFLFSDEDFMSLPLRIIDRESYIVPDDWLLSEDEHKYITSISVTEESCKALEYKFNAFLGI